ncbi:MAG: hypothetical protein A2V86_06990 [Deltaproteobacteria bacterium RBG_16_49_23]|nr:MAG: hypothetical protein A2V86_06990 [Deltaproteobacteria bacterium RBG_16_49_23]
MFVILNEVKNLMISTESIIEILRLSPQNDITTQSQRERTGVRVKVFLFPLPIIPSRQETVSQFTVRPSTRSGRTTK